MLKDGHCSLHGTTGGAMGGAVHGAGGKTHVRRSGKKNVSDPSLSKDGGREGLELII